MKYTKESILRPLIRWSAGFLLTALIIAAMSAFYPLTGSTVAGHLLGWAMAIIAGLQLALPPVTPQEDWVPVWNKSQLPKKTEDRNPAKYSSPDEEEESDRKNDAA